jgi:hypothetical protein
VEMQFVLSCQDFDETNRFFTDHDYLSLSDLIG